MLARKIVSIVLGLIGFYLLAMGINTWAMVFLVVSGFLYRKVVDDGGLW